MRWDWTTVFWVQVLIWCIYLLERKQLKKASKADKFIFTSILLLSAIASFMNLEYLQGPITFLKYIFGPLGRFME